MSDRMLPKLNRVQSLATNATGNGVSPYMGYHSLAPTGSEASPLKLFSRAKQAINSIYSEFDSFIGEIYSFMECK